MNTAPSFTQERLNEIVESLTGTAQCLSDVLTEDEENNVQLLAAIDDQIGECQTCNWWCETNELDENENCTDCAEGVNDPDEDEEDDLDDEDWDDEDEDLDQWDNEDDY